MKKSLQKTAITVAFILTGAALQAQGGFVLFPSGGGGGAEILPEERFVRPVSAPYIHEDAFVTSDVRVWYVHHKFPQATLGGDATVVAAQLRIAITESLQFVAYKDGWIRFDDNAIGSSGWNDIAAGLKWAFYQNWETQTHLAAGLGYEAATGDSKVLQNDDALRLWLSGNKGFGRLHLGFVGNYFMGGDGHRNLGSSDQFTVHLHADYRLNDWISPILEVNGYFVTREGSVVTPFQGLDVVNLGGNSGEDVITAAVGVEIRPFGPDIGLRAAYETVLKQDVGLFNYRWNLSGVWEF